MAIKHRTLPQLTEQQIARIWSKIDKTPGQGPQGECWEWKASLTVSGGYGQINIDGQILRAPRLIWFIATGQDPVGLVIRHKCDWPPCCNPAHLIPGTDRDNVQDSFDRGRRYLRGDYCGTKYPSALAQAFINEVAESKSKGIRAIAARYGIKYNAAYAILTGKIRPQLQRPDSLKEVLASYSHFRLTEADVQEIRQRVAAGEDIADCATRFHVSRSNIRLICKRKIWKHVV